MFRLTLEKVVSDNVELLFLRIGLLLCSDGGGSAGFGFKVVEVGQWG